MKIIHLLSGGLDSVVMLYSLQSQNHQIHCLLFHYEQRHAKELEYAKWHCERLKIEFTIMCLPQLRGSQLTDGQGGVVIPNRNMIMLAHGINLAIALEADWVTYACNADDEEIFPDCRTSFLNAMNEAVREAGCEIEIKAPFINSKKWWIAGHGRNLGVPIDKTWSCYKGGKNPCGECPACLKREEALKK